MRENILFITGAGFSAPLGVPTISNFFERSKDLYDDSSEKYSHFKEIFGERDKLAKILLYYDSDLFNVEEILSILYMGASLTAEKEFEKFSKYVCDVVKASTPKFTFTPPNVDQYSSSNGMHNTSFEPSSFGVYNILAANLLGLSFNLKSDRGGSDYYRIYNRINSHIKYDIISMNYDTVVEDACEWFKSAMKGNYDDLKLFTSLKDDSVDHGGHYAKLHGTVTDNKIIPPTWNKSISSHIEEAWKLASFLLSRANHIRILGYSLPENDNYFKYLLKHSVLDSGNLKSIHVICSDQDGSVNDRYSRFMQFKGFAFINSSIESYFKDCRSSFTWHNDLGKLYAEGWESQHRQFMRKHGISI